MILLMLILFCCCWRLEIPTTDSYESYVKFAIDDFTKRSPLIKKDSVFSISIKEFENGIIGVGIYGSPGKVVVVKDGNTFNLSSLPTGVIESGTKLFYWYNEQVSVTSEVIEVLQKHNYIDTAILNVYIPTHKISHNKKGENYFFCKTDVQKFKKIRTSKSIGSSKVKNLNCKTVHQ